MPHYSLELSETVHMSDSMTARTESDYLIISNKEKCIDLINEAAGQPFNQEQAIDFLIAVHLVLEVGLNTFFRHISLIGIRKSIDSLEIAKNLDQISFIDKTVLFIYNSKFNFGDRIDKATHHHSIIKKMKDFSGTRNKLLHGHSISTVSDASGNRDSEARKLTDKKEIARQVENFRSIMDGLAFYFDCLETSITDSGKADFKKEYLNTDFLIKFPQ